MAGYSAADVKVLRERLGAGMLDSRNALIEAEGDVDKAIEILRLKGQKGVAKREGRATSEGLVVAKEHGGAATMIELACETDFVAKNEKFVALGEQVLEAAIAAEVSTLEGGLTAPGADGRSVEDMISELAAVLGEKIELRRLAHLTGDAFAIYLHKTSKDLPPQVGVVVAYTGADTETARNIAQHISFANPEYLTRDEVPEEAVANERKIVEEISRNEGKPDAALPKIIEGRLAAYFKQVSLLEQGYARDSKLSVAQVLADAGLVVTSFARFKVGA